MSLDARALITCSLGPVLDGSGWSEDFAQDVGLISVKGQLSIDGIITPARGTVVEIGYIKAEPTVAERTLTRFYQRLHVLSSFADPYDNRTTVDVGCQIELQRSRRDRRLFRAAANPPAWWAALPSSLQRQVAPPIQAQAVIQFCLDALGIPLAAGSATSPDWFLRDSFDLADGYIQVIDDLLRSANLLGHMTPAGELLVEQISLTSGTGPVLRRGDLISLLPIQAGEQGAETVTVDFDAIEAPKGIVIAQGREINENGEPVDEEERDEQRRRNWELTRTISPPQTHRIPFTTPAGVRQVAEFQFSSTNETLTQYSGFNFLGVDGELEVQEVVTRSVSTTTECFAAANPSLGASFLENGLSFNGSAPNPRVSITESQYAQGPTGPRLVREVTTDYQTEVEFAGSLGITDYVINGEAYALTSSLVVVGVTETLTEVNDFDALTKRTTTRYRATGRRQPGNQGSAVSSRSAASVDELKDVFEAALTLVSEGTEVQVSRGRDVGIQTRPSQQARSGTFELGQPRDRSDGPDAVISNGATFAPQTVTLEMRFGEGSGDAWASTTFRLPYSPDDFLQASSGTAPNTIDRVLVRGRARDRALEYGRLRNAMIFGHANGVQVQTVPWNLPSRPFAPVFIEAAGLSTAFRTNGRSWEIRGGAVVVSSDLMLAGTLGRLTGAESIPWMPLPSAPSALPELGSPTGSGGIEPGNTIPVPSGFNPNAPGSVWDDLPTDEADTLGQRRTATTLTQPFSEIITVDAAVRVQVVVGDFPYSLEPVVDDVGAVVRAQVDAANVIGLDGETMTISVVGNDADLVVEDLGGVATFATGISGAIYSNNNRTVQRDPDATPVEPILVIATGQSTGKYYLEITSTISAATSNGTIFGFASVETLPAGDLGSGGYGISGDTNLEDLDDLTGGTTATGASPTPGASPTFMLAIDYDAKKIWLGVNGTWANSGDPAAGTGALRSDWTGTPSLTPSILPSGGTVTITATPSYLPTGFTFFPA